MFSQFSSFDVPRFRDQIPWHGLDSASLPGHSRTSASPHPSSQSQQESLIIFIFIFTTTVHMPSTSVTSSLGNSFDSSASPGLAHDDAAAPITTSSPPTSATSGDDHPHLHPHPHPSRRQRRQGPAKLEASASTPPELSPVVLDVLDTYDRLAQGRPPQHSSSLFILEGRYLVWRNFTPEEYAALQTVLAPSDFTPPPLHWNAAAYFHRTEAREEYFPDRSELRLRMPTPVHDTLAALLGDHLKQKLQLLLAAHPSPDVQRYQVIPHGNADIEFRDKPGKRSPDYSLVVKRGQRAPDTAAALNPWEDPKYANAGTPVAAEDNGPAQAEDEEGSFTRDAHSRAEPTGEEDSAHDELPPTRSPSPAQAADIYPATIIEIGYSNTAAHDREDLLDYIRRSDGHTRMVPYVEIPYFDLESRRRHLRSPRDFSDSLSGSKYTVLTLIPGEGSPTTRDVQRRDDVLIPASCSEYPGITLSLEDFLPSPAPPNSSLDIENCFLRYALDEAWKAQREFDKGRKPSGPDNFTLKITKRSLEQAGTDERRARPKRKKKEKEVAVARRESLPRRAKQ